MDGLRGNRKCSLMLSKPTVFKEVLGNHVVELTKFLTAKKWRNKGIASNLFKAVCQEADKKAKILLLVCEPSANDVDLTRLQQFYERHGFIALQTKPKILMCRKNQ